MSKVVVMDHPLIAHKIGIIRKKETGTREFRDMVSEIGALITYEATKDLKLQDVEIETPICKTTVKELAGIQISASSRSRRKEFESACQNCLGQQRQTLYPYFPLCQRRKAGRSTGKN